MPTNRPFSPQENEAGAPAPLSLARAIARLVCVDVQGPPSRAIVLPAVLTVLSGVAVAVLVACAHGQAGPSTVAGAAIPDRVDYNWDVAPILSQNCFACHGNSTQKAGLRLDMQKAAYDPLPQNRQRRAIVPGNPARSELFRRITSADSDDRMPPVETHKTLSARDVAVIERWIKQGAHYENHWSYIPPKVVAARGTKWDSQAVNPIDRYVYQRLARQDLAPSPEADRETLINRVSLDLTGLPPTLAEVDAFVNDKDPGAYAKLVDRLLASSAYAERQAGIWLDVARYADSDGYLNDNEGRFQHPYRDWVISAFQRNIPYDQFVTWQLAGDLLPNPTREQVLATAFGRAGKKSNEGGIIDEEYRVEYVNERTELMGKAFLGLTVGCAKCHDHKYDVISQADYYSLGGFFNSLDERGIHSQGGRATPMGPTQAWPSPLQARALAAAHAVTVAKQAAYQSAVRAAETAAAAKVDAVLRGPARQREAFLKAAGEADLQAYYPFDSGYKASFEPLMIDPPLKYLSGKALAAAKARLAEPTVIPAKAETRDPGLPRVAYDELKQAKADAFANGLMLADTSSLRTRQLLVGLREDQLFWTASGAPGGKPAYVNNVKFVPGARGQGVMLHDSVVAADKGVGMFERTQPYTLDLWVKLRTGKPYEEANLLYNAGVNGGAGYEMLLLDNRLEFNITHQAPTNMISVATVNRLPQGRWIHLTAAYDGNSRASGLMLYIDGRPAQTEILQDRLTRSTFPQGGNSSMFGSYYGLTFGKNFGRPEFIDGSLDEVRVFTRALTPIEVAYLHNPALAGAAPSPQVRTDLLQIAASQSGAVKAAWTDLTAARLAEQTVETPIYQMMVMGDRPQPRTNYILDHGLYNVHLAEVKTQALPRIFPWSDTLPRNRLGLAQWLFDPKNPLTARVYVNRLWQNHFGLGIVDTIEDFGVQGSNPSNPELLDYLAVEFVKSGWDIKHMQKLMVMSATYRQSSNVSQEALTKDPRNVYLERGPRYRMPAELIRDNALKASGLLVAQVGGESVFPYQPAGVWDFENGVHIYPTKVPDDQMHRRTLYTFMKRNAEFPSLVVFDMADRNASSVVRKISNTPLQALVLLNDPQFMEAYRKLAERAIRLTPNADQQIVDIFRLGVRRRPSPAEFAKLKAYRAAELARLSAEPGAARKILAVGVARTDASVDPLQLAAMTQLTAAVMNTPDAYTLR